MKSNRNGGRRERRDFSAEFKAEAVRLVAERRADGVTLAQVGRELEVKPDQLRVWAKQQRRESGSGAAMLVALRWLRPSAPTGAPSSTGTPVDVVACLHALAVFDKPGNGAGPEGWSAAQSTGATRPEITARSLAVWRSSVRKLVQRYPHLAQGTRGADIQSYRCALALGRERRLN